MVAGEPDDVRVKNGDGKWTVRIAEGGKVILQTFENQADAEHFAESQRSRLGLPGKPPINDRIGAD
ncbi:hypothetical protein HB777_12445 [Mesorhizobium loti]|nr:hypothetical protein HB777_12445 [Mesorhizobium loti]